jgi:hypothetical protein
MVGHQQSNGGPWPGCAPGEPAHDAELYCAGQGLCVSSLEAGGPVKADSLLDVAGDYTVKREHMGPPPP